VPVYGYYVFPKPSVHGFPTVDDPADRMCRYLVQPPTVPGLARLWVTSAHRMEVEVGADGPASAPPSGAAAVAPRRAPVGTQIYRPPSRLTCNETLHNFLFYLNLAGYVRPPLEVASPRRNAT
jgi:hypothetical protein